MQKNFCYNIRIKDENWRIMRFFIKPLIKPYVIRKSAGWINKILLRAAVFRRTFKNCTAGDQDDFREAANQQNLL